MKNRFLTSLILISLFSAFTAQAQQAKSPVNEPDLNRPKLFASLPERIAVSKADLQSLISNNPETGKTVSLSLNGKLAGSFDGKVVSTASKYNNKMQSIVIRLSSFNGATFSLTSSLQSDGSHKYTGRIISFQHGDLYELQSTGDQYFLVKKNFYDLVNE